MSLTEEAYQKRIWGSYLILGILLRGQGLSKRHEVWSSLQETDEGYLQNLLTVYKLIDSYAEERDGDVFRGLYNDKVVSMMRDDLNQLEKRFLEASDNFTKIAKEIRTLNR